MGYRDAVCWVPLATGDHVGISSRERAFENRRRGRGEPRSKETVSVDITDHDFDLRQSTARIPRKTSSSVRTHAILTLCQVDVPEECVLAYFITSSAFMTQRA